jgi:hypothetical protein
MTVSPTPSLRAACPERSRRDRRRFRFAPVGMTALAGLPAGCLGLGFVFCLYGYRPPVSLGGRRLEHRWRRPLAPEDAVVQFSRLTQARGRKDGPVRFSDLHHTGRGTRSNWPLLPGLV